MNHTCTTPREIKLTADDCSLTYSAQYMTPETEPCTDNRNRSVTTLLAFIAMIVITGFLYGCDEPFQATEENGRYFFSIYGYLDATADTQWVRITPVRESIRTSSDPIDAHVTLEDLNTGESTIMNDSLFQYAQQAYAWNFWTTMDLEPSHTYQLTAENSDGMKSFVQLTLPDDYPTPIFRTNLINRNQIDIKGIAQLIDLQTIYYIKSPNIEELIVVQVPQLEDTVRTFSGDYIVSFNPIFNEEFVKSGYPTSSVVRREIFIAAATPGTPHFPSLTRFQVALPDGISNVQQGVGYLAGVLTKTIPYETCYDDSGVNPIPCPEVDDSP